MKMISAIPALPVSDTTRAATFYRERLGFISKGDDDRLGIMIRDDIEIHLWEVSAFGTPGAEPHLAGSASCRIRVDGVHALYDEYATAGVIHPNGRLCDQVWGETDFTILDMDGNALGFFAPTPQP